MIYISGLVVASYMTFDQPDLLMSLMVIAFGFGLFLLFSIRKQEDLSDFIRDMGVHFLSVFYVYLPLFFIFKLRELGANYLFFLIFVILIGDSGAYFIGRWVGKHHVYPVASPKKTFEGLVAAIITAAAAGWLATLIFPVEVDIWKAVLSGGLIALVSQLSDPIESLFKRAAHKKDSGTILPGHGGFLDRLDSYIFCSPLLYYLITYFWNA
jgi:phosphatidate cytidylyltransferase